MTPLELWLNQATRRLCRDSAAKVRSEILAHYESSREDAVAKGASLDDAARLALAALGDSRAANRQYRKVLLTSGEARVLRNAEWEGQAICAAPFLKWLLPIIPIAALIGAVAFSFAGSATLARVFLIAGLGTAIWFLVPFFPVYTPARARFFRGLKWVATVAILILAFGRDALTWSWLIASSLWPLFWIEWTRASVRRKLPVSDWPKPLYL